MHQIFTPQTLIQYLYSNSGTVIDEDFLNEIFADDYLLSLFEIEAEKILNAKGRSCEPSKSSLLLVEQMAGATRATKVGDFSSWMFDS